MKNQAPMQENEDKKSLKYYFDPPTFDFSSF